MITDYKKLRRTSPDSELDESPRRKRLRKENVSAAIRFKVHCSPKISSSKLDRSPTLRAIEDAHAKKTRSDSAKLSSKTEEFRTVMYSSPNKSPTGVLCPSKRTQTQSQNQKENRRIAPSLTGLASPYKGISSKTSAMSSSRPDKVSRFFRRPSVDTSSTHIPLKPASFHRRSSGSHALQNKHRNRDNDWIIPFLPLASLPLPTTKVKSSLKLDDLDIADCPLQFSPQICSTPVRKTRSLFNDTPDWTAIPMLGSSKTSDIFMKDDAAFQKDFADLVSCCAPAVSETNVVQSIAIGTKEATRPNDARLAMLLLPSSPPPSLNNDTFDKQPSSESDSTNLRRMFSGLDLTGACSPFQKFIYFTLLFFSATENTKIPAPQEFAEDAMPSHKAKRAKVVVEIPKKTVRFNVKLSSLKGNKAVHKKMKNKGHSQHYRRTPPRIVIDDRSVTADDDEDDELLLTSKGWDWDPLYVHS